MKVSKVVSLVVDQDLCTGCGICVSQCDSKSLSMGWGDSGFLVPQQLDDTCTEEGDCVNVCPFNPFPKEEVKTEDELANIFQKETTYRDDKIGKYEAIYVGYSKTFRTSSSSGGMATYFLSQLFDRKIVDAVVVVNYQEDNTQFYNYKLVTTKEGLLKSSKTRYYPVTLDEAIKDVMAFNGKVAIVGVGCFLKAVRLKQFENPSFNAKVEFLIGIICGGLKSKYYTDFLSSKTVNNYTEISKPEYRIKKSENKASDYYFGLDYKKEKHSLRMQSVGDMWGTGFFKSNACDFCEDVTSELADVSLGDAWLTPYVNEGDGNSVVVTRNKLAEKIILDGVKSEELQLASLSKDDLKKSQSGSFNHRHKGLKYRVDRRVKLGKLTPPKRHRNLFDVPLPFKIVQYFRQRTRRKSISNWLKHRKSKPFESSMKQHLLILRIVTKVYHETRKIGWK